MHLGIRSTLFLSFALLAPASHADIIDDFTYTSTTHTITYSLPATSSFPDHPNFNFFSETTTATIDGVSGYSLSTFFYITPSFGYVAILNAPSAIFGSSMLGLSGQTFFTYVYNPAPLYNYQDNVVPTFTPGTYTLRANLLDPSTGTTSVPGYTLTITPEAASTPEPSTLILLATGTLALLARRKLNLN